MKNKKKQKSPSPVANSCVVPVANCHVAGAYWLKTSCARVLTVYRGKRRRRSAAAVARLRRVSGEGEVTDGCGGEWRRWWWCRPAAIRPL